MPRISVKPLLDAGFNTKGLKKWNSREGGGYQFNLTYGGKVVAEVTNEGNGGATDIRWIGLRQNGSLLPAERLPPAQVKVVPTVQAAHAKLAEIVASTAPVSLDGIDSGWLIQPDAGWLMEELVNHHDLMKLLVKKTAIRLPTDDPHMYRTINAPYDAKIKAHIEGKYPGAVILNENPFA